MSFYLHYALLVVLLYVSLTVNCSPFFDDYENPLTAKRFSEFNCFKKKSCTPGPPKVCGYDIKTMEMAEFEDKCTYYRVNCEGGFFKIVDMLACESKKAFTEMQNSTQFQWNHINTTYLKNERMKQDDTTTTDSTVWDRVLPGIVQSALKKIF